MFSHSKKLNTTDPAIAKLIDAEVERQEQHIELIASENFTSPNVMEAVGAEWDTIQLNSTDGAPESNAGENGSFIGASWFGSPMKIYLPLIS